jgi:hypothetical protein
MKQRLMPRWIIVKKWPRKHISIPIGDKFLTQPKKQFDPNADIHVLNRWNELLDDMHGDDAERKKGILEAAIQDDNVSSVAKAWLKKLCN